RVLPDIDAQNRRLAAHVRAVLIGAREDLELAVRKNEPRPAAAETLDAGVLDLGLEGREIGEGRLDVVGQWPGRIATGLARHDLPEHGVVGVPAPVVDDSLPDAVGHLADVAQEL